MAHEAETPTITKLERDAIEALRRSGRSASGLNYIDPSDLWSLTGLLRRALPRLAARGLVEGIDGGCYRLLPAFDRV